MIRENVNLSDPETVKLFINKYKNWSDGHKNTLRKVCAQSSLDINPKLEEKFWLQAIWNSMFCFL